MAGRQQCVIYLTIIFIAIAKPRVIENPSLVRSRPRPKRGTIQWLPPRLRRTVPVKGLIDQRRAVSGGWQEGLGRRHHGVAVQNNVLAADQDAV
jgi:hypothetical protein